MTRYFIDKEIIFFLNFQSLNKKKVKKNNTSEKKNQMKTVNLNCIWISNDISYM